MRFLTHFSRIFVGVLFIISGLIKLNDPVGFSYKLGEYFGETVLNFPALIPYSLGIALIVVIVEVMLGVMLLLGVWRRWTVYALLVMIIFFTFLTFYSAYYNKVTDCGCFGDALKLTPWQSFTKDIVLLAFILILSFNLKYIRTLFSKTITNVLLALSLAFCIFLGYYVLNHLPVVDFRAYKVGNNIKEGMSVPEGAPKSVVEMIFIYNVNGQNKEFTEKDLMSIPPGAKFVDRKDKIITQGYIPPIHDFTLEKDGFDHTEELLNEPKLLMVVMYDLSKTDQNGAQRLEKLNKQAMSKGYKVIAVTASLDQEIDNFKKMHGLTMDFYFCDATTLKTIERANPSIIVLHKGTIVQKLHHNDVENLKL
jgi:uncharacterized membrane protein YphA (DoxX/SURF4 family)